MCNGWAVKACGPFKELWDVPFGVVHRSFFIKINLHVFTFMYFPHSIQIHNTVGIY
jgi:hypothetical protein